MNGVTDGPEEVPGGDAVLMGASGENKERRLVVHGVVGPRDDEEEEEEEYEYAFDEDEEAVQAPAKWRAIARFYSG